MASTHSNIIIPKAIGNISPATWWQHPVFRALIPVILFLLLACRFCLLSADFPAWMNTSGDLYTDEGWWATNAITQYLTGHWYHAGGYNPAIVSPIVPLCEYLAFRCFGMSLVTARVVSLVFFLLTCCSLYTLTALLASRKVALITILLLAANILVFFFSRLALLEMPLTFFIATSVLTAVLSGKVRGWRALCCTVTSALCFLLAILTKTTAIFMFPVLLALFFFPPALSGSERRKKITLHLGIFLLLLLTLSACYAIYTTRHFPVDMQTYARNNITNKIPGLQYVTGIKVQSEPHPYLSHVNHPLYVIPAWLLLLTGVYGLRKRVLRTSLLYRVSLAWAGLYLLIISQGNYLPPRYLVHFIFPISVVVALWCSTTWQLAPRWRQKLIITLTFYLVPQLILLVCYLSTPHYSLLSMARDVGSTTQAIAGPDCTLIGDAADTVSLVTHQRAMNSEMGNTDFAGRIANNHLDFYLSLAPLSPWRLSIIEQQYSISLLKTYTVFNNYYTKHPVCLYRLVKK